MKTLTKLICVLLCLATILPLTFSCGCKKEEEDETIKLSFKSALSYDYLKSIDGKKVSINGYIATNSPVNGSFIFLMNMPYQSCPFCVPNSTQLSNTIEAYPKRGEKFSYTSSAVKVVGTLMVAPSQDQPFSDAFGYTFNFKIVDASYEVLKSSDMGKNFAVWEKFSQSGVIDEINKMYEYVNFICTWNEYYVSTRKNDKGERLDGYYLSPENVKYYLEYGDKKYGTDPEYFNNLIKRIEAIDPTAFSALVSNVREAEALANKAYDKFYNKEYAEGEKKYYELFGNESIQYTITDGDALINEYKKVYSGFSNWLGGWEL